MKKTIILFINALLWVPLLFAQPDSTLYPVSLSSFKVSGVGSSVNLRWETVCYLSFANFNVQRSNDGVNFTTFHSFSADRLRCQQPFFLADNFSNANPTVFYRINVSDIDGRLYHSKIVPWKNEGISDEFLSVYPNVVSSQASIVLASPVAAVVSLQLVNTAGAVVKRYQYNVGKGVTNLNLNIPDVSNGNYWLSATDASGVRHTVSLIKI